MFLTPEKVNESLIITKFKNLKLLPPGQKLFNIENSLKNADYPSDFLKNSLKKLSKENLSDYIIVDCPPSVNLVTLNALAASDYVIVPIQCEYYALEGLSQLISTIRQVKRQYNASLELLGILFTMYNKRLKLTVQVEHEVKKYLKNKVFKTTIPRTVRLSESPSYGKPVIHFDKSSAGAKSYLGLAKEVIERCEKQCGHYEN